MNWFDTSGLTNLAKTALKEAQKTLDKALDIQEENSQEEAQNVPSHSKEKSPDTNVPQKDTADFFASWGLTVSAESTEDEVQREQCVITESPSKSTSQSVWGSFTEYFEQPQAGMQLAIVKPPKAQSMNLISDKKFSSDDDLFSKSQLLMVESADDLDLKKNRIFDVSKVDERRDSSRSNLLSLVSSSDSVEILSHSLKTTPDSETVSVHSTSHSSSAGHKVNSESVEILADSSVSPSIECLGFDSRSSDSTSSILSPTDSTDKKSTPIEDRTENAGDSVSLVPDDDEDTISYNSISECTAPTVLDTDEKLSVSPNCKSIRSIEPHKKFIDKDFIHSANLEHLSIQQKMQISENSSNDGSCSDRTLNADNDSINLDATLEEPRQLKEPSEPEEIIMDKLSDSSSFYNVAVSGKVVQSESSVFVNVETQKSSPGSSEATPLEGSSKERISPVSSDSKSDLVKIGSDRTSGHTSGDDLETATSSDIEIIPSPNGEAQGFSRNSPAKYPFKQKDECASPNLVDLVLGKSLANKIRGHNRELSEASIQSNISDESQGSESERLVRRLSEMAEILEVRESRLMEVSRNNVELEENNAELKSQLHALQARHEGSDIMSEDYTQRMSALEKKFQQAIREKDQLRKQLEYFKNESSRKNSSEMENMIKEKDEVIIQLQEEGEKLSQQQLQHSNIIKKLRAKEKDNEQVIKSLRDKISEQTAELDRLKRAMTAKEELEVSQIEAVYRLTTAAKKMETELLETKGALEDKSQALETTQISLEAARRELGELQRGAEQSQRWRGQHEVLLRDKDAADHEVEVLREQLRQLRAELVQEEKRWIARSEALRHEASAARELAASLEASVTPGDGHGAAALLAQLATLQQSALQRDQSHQHHTLHLNKLYAEAEFSLAKAVERERLAREESGLLQERLVSSEREWEETRRRLGTLQEQYEQQQSVAYSKQCELEERVEFLQCQVQQLEVQLREAGDQLAGERAALEAERKRNTILQEQLSARGELSPSQSFVSDTLSSSLWPQEDCAEPTMIAMGTALCGVEELTAVLSRKEGELRARGEEVSRLAAERRVLAGEVARLQSRLQEHQSVQEQYDALLQMYGEKEEQLAEVRLDLQDVTQLYKAQLDELVALKHQVRLL